MRFDRPKGPYWGRDGWFEEEEGPAAFDPRLGGPRYYGPRFGGPRFGGPGFFRPFFGGPWRHHHHHGHGHGPTPEQQATWSTAAEVARLFAIASRSAQGNPEKQAQLRAFLESSRKELADLIYGTGNPENTAPSQETNVEQA